MRTLLLAYDVGLQGGVGTFNYELASSLAELGVETVVIARGSNIGLSNNCKNLEIHSLPSINIPPKNVIFYSLNMKRITEIAKSERIDVIHDSSTSIGFMPWLSKVAPVVVTVHGSPSLGYLRHRYGSSEDVLRCELFDLAHQLPSRFLSLFCKPEIKKQVFVSKSCFEDAAMHIPPRLKEEFFKKSCVVYNGLSVKRLRSLQRKGTRDLNIVFMGRLMEYKGVDRAINALPLVIKELRDVKLHVIGSGPQLSKLMNLAERRGVKDRVTFHGWLSRSEALKILAGSSILVHPSVYESFGYSIVEAYALGKPVIAHRAPYSMELVESMGAGITVNTFDKHSLADAITTLLSDKSLYEGLSRRALQVAERYFDITKTAQSYIKVYEEAISGQ